MKYEFQELNWGEKVFLVSGGSKNAPCLQALLVGAPAGRGSCWSGLLGAELEGSRAHFSLLTLPSILTSPALLHWRPIQ